MPLREIDGLWVLEQPELKSDLIFKLEAVLAKNCENGKRNRNPNLKFNAHENHIIYFLLLLAYRDYVFPASVVEYTGLWNNSIASYLPIN